jgi:hypothetical protein
VLFVTRFITEANNFVERVNRIAGRKIAAAYYRGSPTSLADAARFPVLAITHAACERHQLTNTVLASGGTIWDHLTGWHHGRRAKIIIDETPNFITPVQISSNWLSHTLAALKWLPGASKTLYLNMELLFTSITEDRDGGKNRQMSCAEFDVLDDIDVQNMREHLSSIEEYALTLGSGIDKIPLRAVCDRTLTALESVKINRWAWVSYRGKIPQINSATLHPSLRHGSGVILDGTAALYAGYSLLSPPAKVITAPESVRNYANVTLYVARGHKAGKTYLGEHALKHWPLYREAIEAELQSDERVLVCAHKEFREKVDVAPFPRISFAHYGKIDGRNDWKEYEAVALIGLPYLDQSTPANIAQALLGQQSSEWLQTSLLRGACEHEDVLKALHRGHMCASAVQAINRVRCRAAIDSMGNCKPTSVFIALPNGEDGDAVLSAIAQNMPGVQMKAWKVATAKRKQRTVPTSEALVGFFMTAPAGVYTKSQVRAVTRISPASLDRTIKRLDSATSAERRRFNDLRITYFPQHGKGAHSYFVKA